MAAQRGHVEVVRLLLGAGANFEQGTSSGWSPLLVAAWSGHVGVVNLLLEAGANTGVTTTVVHLGIAVGSTPLEIATAMGHSTVVAVLRGAAGVIGE
jgi:ankyrin repeat protein